MPPPLPAIYENGGAALLGTFTFGIVDTGAASAAITFEFWNDKGGGTADTLNGLSINFLESAPSLNEWNQRGLDSQQRWIEFRAVGVIGDATPYLSDWMPTGSGRPFRLPPIPAASARVIEVRRNVPSFMPSFDSDFWLSADYDRSAIPFGGGLYETGGRGVVAGIGDGTFSYLATGGALTASGSPDDEVHLADLIYVHKGVPRVILATDIAVNGDALDGALIAGEAYWATLSVGAAGTVTQTKSNAGTAPLPITSRPAVPAGELLVGYVHRDFDAAITTSDIYQDAVRWGLFRAIGSGLVLTLQPGVALVDDRLVRYETPRTLTLPTSEADIRIWLRAGEPTFTTDESKPDARAELIYVCTTDGAAITAIDDRRKVIRLSAVRFDFPATLTTSSASYAMLPTGNDAHLSPLYPVVAALRDIGAGTGGRTAFEIEYLDGATWASAVTLFTDSGTVDRRPAFAFDAANLVSRAAVPQVMKLPPFTPLRCRCIEVPSGGTAPGGAEVLLFHLE